MVALKMVKIKGKMIDSNTVTLTIIEPTQSSGIDRGLLFLKAMLSSKKVYVEEQAIYTLRLYRRVRVRDISLNLPETEHLTFKKLVVASQFVILLLLQSIFSHFINLCRDFSFNNRPFQADILSLYWYYYIESDILAVINNRNI